MLFDVVIFYYKNKWNGVAYRVNATTHELVVVVRLVRATHNPHATPERDGNIDFLEFRNGNLRVLALGLRLLIRGEAPLNFDRDGVFG